MTQLIDKNKKENNKNEVKQKEEKGIIKSLYKTQTYIWLNNIGAICFMNAIL